MVDFRKKLAFAGLVAVVAVLGFTAGNRVLSQIPQSQQPWSPATVRPFVAHITKRSYNSTSSANPHVVRLVYARRTDRSSMTQMPAHRPDGSIGGTIVSITDTPYRQMVLLEPFTKSKVTEIYADREFALMLSSNLDENCPAAPAAGQEAWQAPIQGGVFFGHNSVYTMTATPIRSGGSETVERWTSLTEAEPSKDMSSIPSDYTERSPLEMETAYKELKGVEFWGEQIATRREARYRRLRR